jgi:hypothetical protein
MRQTNNIYKIFFITNIYTLKNMGCAYCYAMFTVLLFIVLYHGPKWFSMDGFENYTKIYKSEDGYYLAIKEGHDKNPEGLNLFLQNDWVKFKEMIDRYDKNKNKEPLGLGFYNNLTTQEEKPWELEIKDFFTFYFMRIAGDMGTQKGVETIIWQPQNTAGAFGQTFLHMKIKNNGTLIEANFELNGTSKFRKTFTLYTAPVASKPPAILST